MTLTIRLLEHRDLDAVVQMIDDLAEHHGDVPVTDPATLARDALGPAPWVHVLVAETTARLIGYAALLPLAQMQIGVRGMDMHHLFVRPEGRGSGVGRAFIDASKEHARMLNCSFLTVGTHPDNRAAAAFYVAAGFIRRPMNGPRFSMRLDQPLT